jgi:stringent starvation protein B
MTSSKPYLLNGLYEWIVDNDCTPYVLVDAFAEGVEVPLDFVKDGQIVLNIAPRAVTGLQIDAKGMFFNARFGGIPTDVMATIPSIMGIYARENGQGMMFDKETTPPGNDQPPSGPKLVPKAGDSSKKSEKPSLKIVK